MTGKFTLPDIRDHFGDNEEEMQPQHGMFTVHFSNTKTIGKIGRKSIPFTTLSR